MKINCWEYKNCGRQPNGHNALECGVCPVTTCGDLDGVHGGKNAGRACWVVAGSLCCDQAPGEYAEKLDNCWRCEFMLNVKKTEETSPEGFFLTRLSMGKNITKQRALMRNQADQAQLSCCQRPPEEVPTVD